MQEEYISKIINFLKNNISPEESSLLESDLRIMKIEELEEMLDFLNENQDFAASFVYFYFKKRNALLNKDDKLWNKIIIEEELFLNSLNKLLI